jgi:hypothetical protein
LFSTLFLEPIEAIAELKIDGRLDEPDWAEAQVFNNFVVIDPLSFETPRMATEAKILSIQEGLAVGFICKQPQGETRTHTITQRDSSQFYSDSVSFMIDFDDTGVNAYEFSVSVTGSYRDGTITNENNFNNDWDGLWERAVNEESERWTVEILLPWSIVAMLQGSGETRRIAVFFQREVYATGEKFAFPATSSTQTRFVSDFARIEVSRYSARELDVWPYVTVLSDFVNKSTRGKAGLDLFWKASSRFQTAATFNPDFGQVESDDLVINFTAIETRFSDKRPFFTENQGIFSSLLPRGDRIFYTRRIGGPSDRDGRPSDIDGALKSIGSAGPLNYGFFAAQEEGEAGRTFLAGRIIFPGENWSVGALSTYVERPFLDRTALVNTLDYDVKPVDSWRWYGEVINGIVDTDTGSSDGLGGFIAVEYTPNDRWAHDVSLLQYTDSMEINDMGYIQRNNLEELHGGTEYRQTDFPENSRTASITWSAKGVVRRNMKGVRLIDVFTLSREQKMRSGVILSFYIRYATDGYDDLVSRGNGLVHLNELLSATFSYSTPKRGAWRKSISLSLFQEGYEDWGAGFDTNVIWYPHDKLNLDLRLNPKWSSDWLIWLQGDRFASFSRRNVTGEITANYFPAEGHEVRLRSQWLTIKAEAEQGYRIGPGGRLVPGNDMVNDFAMINFGLQLRYRYEIAPLSDLYVVYSRGGLERIDDPSKGTMDLLSSSTSLRNSDQFLVKLRYRF